MKKIFTVLILGCLLTVMLFLVSIARSGTRNLGQLETIQGIPFFVEADSVHITEKLAHADVFLKEPVLGKYMTITIAFTPRNEERLALGVRENAFWLSYEPVVFYDKARDFVEGRELYITTVDIPLTDKLQEKDRSLDLMIFTDAEESLLPPADSLKNSADWYVHSLSATVAVDIPSYAHAKHYLKSIITRERAL